MQTLALILGIIVLVIGIVGFLGWKDDPQRMYHNNMGDKWRPKP